MCNDKFEYFFSEDQGRYVVEVSKKNLQKVENILKENMDVKIEFHEENPLIVTLPKSADYEILETEAVVKGQTVSSSYKPAIIQNNVKIMVPPFINQGDTVSIDCHTREYIKKAN